MLATAAALASCARTSEIAAFSSDGCSLFPDRSQISAADWCGCCYEHDLAYWQGGVEKDRGAADAALRDCVATRTDNQALAESMFLGVRAGGSAYFPTWYRWGYGWPYGRGYEPLTDNERESAAKRLAEYEAAGTPNVCASVNEVALWTPPPR